MSKINNLIKELCPNGVRYYKLSEIGNQFSGLSGKSKKDFENGNCKYITYTNIYNNPSTNLDVEDYVQVKENEKQNEIKSRTATKDDVKYNKYKERKLKNKKKKRKTK